MPELPEVETIARTLTPLICGQRVRSVEIFHGKSVEAASRPLVECSGFWVHSVSRRGKLVLIHLGSAEEPLDEQTRLCLAVHLKMTGRLFVYPATSAPEKHTRIRLGFESGSQLFFDDARTFGYMRLLSESPQSADFAHWTFWKKLGAEPLLLTPDEFCRLFATRKSRIKALLLDQTIVAGIGNIYADESLFRARIRPDIPASKLSHTMLCSLHHHIQAVLQEAINACGSSIRDYRTAQGDAGAFQNKFNVYGKAGQPCPVCHAPLQKAQVAGRTTVFCALCQKELKNIGGGNL